jgi:hypothetical protein
MIITTRKYMRRVHKGLVKYDDDYFQLALIKNEHPCSKCDFDAMCDGGQGGRVCSIECSKADKENSSAKHIGNMTKVHIWKRMDPLHAELAKLKEATNE